MSNIFAGIALIGGDGCFFVGALLIGLGIARMRYGRPTL
jgi:hypothetical protein